MSTQYDCPPQAGWPLYSAAQVRELDHLAIATGVSADTLMQRAGVSAFMLIQNTWPSTKHVLVLCGSGNNAGDGYIVAEQAKVAGLAVTLLRMGESLTDTARTAFEAARLKGVYVEDFTSERLSEFLVNHRYTPCVIVDALLGIGIAGALRPRYREVVERVNSSDLPVLALDVPSGLNSDTGQTDDIAMHCDATISFIGRKKGLFTGLAADFVGEMHFDDLGTSSLLSHSDVARNFSARAINAGILRRLISPRSRSAHKGRFGHVLVIGGDQGFGGAAILAADAAARAGAGTVSLVTRCAHVSAMLARRPEVMVLGVEDWAGAQSGRVTTLLEKASAIVLGPGLGQSTWSSDALECVLGSVSNHKKPVVLDADALNLFARQHRSWQDCAPAEIRQQWVLTPHPGEASRLLGITVGEIQADRYAAVRALQELSGAVCLIKGAGTVIAFPDQYGGEPGRASVPVDVCTAGNPGMATGGMGDVLAGVTGALLAQGLSAADAVRVSVCAHGAAGDRAAAANGERGMLATDLFVYLQAILNFR